MRIGSDGARARPTDAIEGGDGSADTTVGAASTGKVAVLLVDDETLVRDVVEAALEEGGYRVVAAQSGQAALERLDARNGDCRVLVTDIDLGRGPTGWDVARRAREIDPDVAVVYISAAGLHEHASEAVSHSAVLAKPFDAARILAEVARLVRP